MKIDEHKALLNELNSDKIELSRKMEIINTLSDDYTITQAELTTTTSKVDEITKDRDHFATLSKKLWLENSATLTGTNTTERTNNETTNQHQAKRTMQDLMSKF